MIQTRKWTIITATRPRPVVGDPTHQSQLLLLFHNEEVVPLDVEVCCIEDALQRNKANNFWADYGQIKTLQGGRSKGAQTTKSSYLSRNWSWFYSLRKVAVGYWNVWASVKFLWLVIHSNDHGMHTHARMHSYTHACTHTHMHAHIHTCMHTRWRRSPTWATFLHSSKTWCILVTSKSVRLMETWASPSSSKYQPTALQFFRGTCYKHSKEGQSILNTHKHSGNTLQQILYSSRYTHVHTHETCE